MKSARITFEKQFDQEIDSLWRFGFRLTSDSDAASCLVEKTLGRALEQRHISASSRQVRSWLFRLAHRIWQNEIRVRHLRLLPSLGASSQMVVSLGAPPSFARDSGSLSQTYSLMDQLPEAQRLVFLLVYGERFSYSEVGEILDISIATVKSRLVCSLVFIGRSQKQASLTSHSHEGVQATRFKAP